jgi:hypothetical protein
MRRRNAVLRQSNTEEVLAADGFSIKSTAPAFIADRDVPPPSPVIMTIGKYRLRSVSRRCIPGHPARHTHVEIDGGSASAASRKCLAAAKHITVITLQCWLCRADQLIVVDQINPLHGVHEPRSESGATLPPPG